MKYLDEYRDPVRARRLLDQIGQAVKLSWTIMEVCGGQTHTLVRSGIDELLPKSLRLVHGPGCPVCVTPLEEIDRALAIAAVPGVIFTSFGDMLRVPGSNLDLLRVRAQGGDVRAVYSPLDALKIARENPNHQVVFFAVGFETTAPATALAVYQAKSLRLSNFSMLVSHVLVPPAMDAILQSPGNQVQAFLAPGHVCTIMGVEPYQDLANRYRVPVVVTGFEPVDLLEGILMTVHQLETGQSKMENQYARSVSVDGNRHAQNLISQVYELCDQSWRGLGIMPQSGLQLKKEFSDFDASIRFPTLQTPSLESTQCRAREVLLGMIRPAECQAFGSTCNPDHPLGAPMVSSEGACAAYWKYGRVSQSAVATSLSAGKGAL